MDKGDFIVQFMDMTEDEMKQDVENIMPTRLESLLELALRTSTANVDPYKDDLKYVFELNYFSVLISCEGVWTDSNRVL